jgi:two-component system OmpR family response regulator
MAKILFVEDDTNLAEMVNEWLTFEHHNVEVVNDGRDGLDRIRLAKYDLVILDRNLPRVDGVEICRAHRSDGGTTPIIMLTGMNAISDKETGLDTGADDYLTKPFSVKELSARIRALLRRSSHATSNVLKARNIVLDPIKHTISKDGVEVHLLPREFALLEFFMRHPGEVYSSEALLQRIWQTDSEASPDAVRTCLKRLRRKIDDSDNEDKSLIQTVPRVGYRMRTD